MNDKTQTYQVYCGVNYTIYLDTEGKFEALQIATENYSYKVCFEEVYLKKIKHALKLLFIEEPEKFNKLYTTLKENDPEIFKYVDSVVESIEEYCKNLKS